MSIWELKFNTNLILISYCNSRTYQRFYESIIYKKIAKAEENRKLKAVITEEVAKGIAAGVIDEASVLVVFLGSSHYLWLSS